MNGAQRRAITEWLAEKTPEGGWWRQNTGDTLRAAAITLIGAGIETQTALDTLDDVIGAIRQEYGE